MIAVWASAGQVGRQEGLPSRARLRKGVSMPAAVGPVCAQPAATSAWDHLPQTVADVLFNRLDARSAAAARLVCAGWGRQLTGVRARLRPSSARLPRGWSTRLPAVRRLDLRDCPPEGRHGRSTVRLDAALEVSHRSSPSPPAAPVTLKTCLSFAYPHCSPGRCAISARTVRQ